MAHGFVHFVCFWLFKTQFLCVPRWSWNSEILCLCLPQSVAIKGMCHRHLPRKLLQTQDVKAKCNNRKSWRRAGVKASSLEIKVLKAGSK